MSYCCSDLVPGGAVVSLQWKARRKIRACGFSRLRLGNQACQSRRLKIHIGNWGTTPLG